MTFGSGKNMTNDGESFRRRESQFSCAYTGWRYIFAVKPFRPTKWDVSMNEITNRLFASISENVGRALVQTKIDTFLNFKRLNPILTFGREKRHQLSRTLTMCLKTLRSLSWVQRSTHRHVIRRQITQRLNYENRQFFFLQPIVSNKVKK